MDHTSPTPTPATGSAPLPLSTPESPLRRPRALLLDFGGVVFETSKHPDGRDRVVEWMEGFLRSGGFDLSPARLRTALDAGLAGLKHWKNASSRRREPRELSPREIVVDFLASDLPDGPRELLATEARSLLRLMNTAISGHTVREGIPEVLRWCREHGIALGIVSNAHSGASHRDLLAAHGLADSFGVQVYSDEVGIRKPHPGMIRLAAEALEVSPAGCWYVGDTQDRDIVAGRRAAVGAVIITRCHHTDAPPFPVHETADAVLDTPAGLLGLLQQATPPDTSDDGPVTTGGRGTDVPGDPVSNRGGEALLIDHGGVMVTSHEDPESRQKILGLVAETAGPPPEGDGPGQTTRQRAEELLSLARQRYSDAKGLRRDTWDRLGSHEDQLLRDVAPQEFWDLGQSVDAGTRARLIAASAELMDLWGRTKSRRVLRPGITELFEHCAQAGIPVVVVSNTVAGSGVRATLEEHGLTDLVRAVIASDEFGLRKPHPAIAAAGLAIARADPNRTWFLGDKPQNDAAAARAVGISHRVLVRGGSTAEPELAGALESGLATALIDHPGELVPLLTGR